MLKSQRAIIRTFTLHAVTICLYLSPSNRARSLSTLIAVIVNKDTPANTKPVVLKRIQKASQPNQRSGERKRPLRRGCEIRPTPISVHAKQLSKSFDGGWREDTFRRAMMIKIFPKIAVMDRGTVNVKDNILWLAAAPRPEVQIICFVATYFLSSVKFSIASVWFFPFTLFCCFKPRRISSQQSLQRDNHENDSSNYPAEVCKMLKSKCNYLKLLILALTCDHAKRCGKPFFFKDKLHLNSSN